MPASTSRIVEMLHEQLNELDGQQIRLAKRRAGIESCLATVTVDENNLLVCSLQDSETSRKRTSNNLLMFPTCGASPVSLFEPSYLG
jgi:hypothetical protein